MTFLRGVWRRAFWNPAEQRLRAGWRILLHLVLIIALMAVIGLVIGLALPMLSLDSLALQVGGFGIAVTLATWMAVRLIDRRRLDEVGMAIDRAWWLDLAAGLLLGILLMTGIFLIELSLGWIEVIELWRAPVGSSFAWAIWAPILAYLFVGFYEELLSRGYHLVNLAEGFSWLGARGGIWAAWILSSAIFGALHAGNPNATLVSTINIGVAGLFLGAGMVLTGRLALPIGLHITWNLFQGNVFGFPVSGTQASEATVFAIRQGGPSLWTGGAFGPEAGLLGLLAMVVGTGLTLLWVIWREGHLRIHRPLALYSPRAQNPPSVDASD